MVYVQLSGMREEVFGRTDAQATIYLGLDSTVSNPTVIILLRVSGFVSIACLRQLILKVTLAVLTNCVSNWSGNAQVILGDNPDRDDPTRI